MTNRSLPCVLFCESSAEPLLGWQQNSLKGGQCEKRTPNTDRPGKIVGLLNLAQIYFLYMDLRHSSWLLDRKSEVHPMFLSFFIPIGVFLLLAARKPSQHRSMIALAAWLHISHGTVMAIQTVEAWNHGIHRNFADVILFIVIGVVLLALLPSRAAGQHKEGARARSVSGRDTAIASS